MKIKIFFLNFFIEFLKIKFKNIFDFDKDSKNSI